GGGFSFGFGFGNLGWLAIGPGDFFHPWWGWGVSRVGFAGFGRFGYGGFGPLYRGRNGFSNIGRFDNNARIRAGVTSIRGDQFGHGAGSFQRGLSTQEFHQANFTTGRLPAVPNRESLGRVEDHVSPGIARSASANNEHFFSQSRASAGQRSFGAEASAQQRAIDGSRRADSRSFGAASGEHGGASGRGNSNGWRSFSGNGNARAGQGQGNTPNRPAMQQSRRGQQGNPSRGGSNPWHQFTPPSNNGRGQQPSRNSAPRSSSPREGSGYGSYSRGGSHGNYSYRPQLDMRQPVVSQPSYGGSNRGYGGYSGRSSAGSSRAYSSRSSGGGYRGGGGARGGGGSHGGGHGGGHHR
ncbi:MAG: hypothetical protein WBF30_00370, partial [Candidatus Acidiferrales bacterium]